MAQRAGFRKAGADGDRVRPDGWWRLDRCRDLGLYFRIRAAKSAKPTAPRGLGIQGGGDEGCAARHAGLIGGVADAEVRHRHGAPACGRAGRARRVRPAGHARALRAARRYLAAKRRHRRQWRGRARQLDRRRRRGECDGHVSWRVSSVRRRSGRHVGHRLGGERRVHARAQVV